MIPETARVFRSALKPFAVELRVDMSRTALSSLHGCIGRVPLADDAEGGGAGGGGGPASKADLAPRCIRLMFKAGDDLRQDQLVLQLIDLMDSLLQAEHMDMRLTPYRVLATGVEHGVVEFVEKSYAFSKVGNVRAFLKKHNPDRKGRFGISPEVRAAAPARARARCWRS